MRPAFSRTLGATTTSGVATSETSTTDTDASGTTTFRASSIATVGTSGACDRELRLRSTTSSATPVPLAPRAMTILTEAEASMKIPIATMRQWNVR